MIHFGIVGCGNIAHKFAEAVKLVHEATVTCCASHDLSRAQSFARETGIKTAYGKYEDLFSSQEVDIVYVATTCNFHYENIKGALLSGKSVLCEKTMATTSKETIELFSLAKEKGLFLFEGMWSLFLPAIQKAKQWIDDGRIGDISLASYFGGIHAPSDNRIFNKELGGGAFLDLTVYPYEILSFLLGKPGKLVKSDLTFANGVDTVNSIIMDFEGTKGMIATTVYARIPSPSGIFGNKGYILIEQTHRADTVRLFDDNFILQEEFTSFVSNGFEYEIQEACNLFKQKATKSRICTPELTISFLKLMEESIYENR
ncbi:MAG: Gfo/Idh/MocA family oxidoreductase [Sphaerochaetaceae bacterium]|nr:Gfo/Idh/MocA family oxidoreductase [Sphaerochaetaceae bacterium]